MSLLAGAGLSALAIVGAATAADAKPVKHRHVAAASSSQAEEIKLLKQQVEMLTARLDAQEAAQQQTQVQAQAANDQAQAAITQAQAATAATEKVPDQVKTSLASWKPKGGWWDNTTISGRMYFNASTIDQKSNGTKTATTGTGFNIKRFYLGIDHKFDDIFSANLTTDVDNVVGNNSANLVGKGLYIKKAYLQAKLDKAFWVRLGAADLPWIPYVEGVYGYRHIENTVTDRDKFGTSSDWGVHVGGDLADGIISYQVSVVDGAGYRNVKVTKSVDVEGRVSASYKGFLAAVGGYTGKLGADVQGIKTPNTASRLDGLVGYKSKLFTVGGEYFTAKNYSASLVTSTTTKDKAEGYSLFASVNPMDKVSIFGRYDWVKPKKDVAPDMRDKYFNVGVQYSPAKIVDLALVYKHNKVTNGSLSTSNGTIGGINSITDGSYNEFGLFGQFRF
jgi:hypothetical protein